MAGEGEDGVDRVRLAEDVLCPVAGNDRADLVAGVSTEDDAAGGDGRGLPALQPATRIATPMSARVAVGLLGDGPCCCFTRK